MTPDRKMGTLGELGFSLTVNEPEQTPPVSKGWPTTDRLSVLQSVITHESDDPISEWASNIQAAINAAAWAVENRPRLEAHLIALVERRSKAKAYHYKAAITLAIDELRAILKEPQ